MTARTKTTSSTVSNKERLILFHTPDPTELGINLTHGPDGHVRITCNEVDIANSSIIDGKLTNGDLVCEAAGVNMRHPISDHMWKLTLGLMKVAPRPIEIYVVSDDDGIVSDDEKINDGMDVSGAAVNNTSYYQLEATGENKNIITAQAFNILDGSPLRRNNKNEVLDVSLLSSVGGDDDDNSVNNDEHLQQQIAAVRNPFQDEDRFGPERRIIFHTQSLGVKLHRSPTEGIVHIIHVTPYIPYNSKPVREGPDNGHIEPGDTIFEVGGVDLRNKVIGRLEWADMVHFIKHVGRPLDMIIAKDKLFTRERAGVANVFDRDVRNVQAAVEAVQLLQRQEREENNVVDVNESAGGDDEDKENQEEQHQPNPLVDNACFNVAVDDICNLPCTGGSGGDANEKTGIIVSTSPKRQDNSWIKKFDDDQQQGEKKVELLAKNQTEKNEDDNNDIAVADVSLVRDNMWSPKSKDHHPWIKNVQQVEGDSEPEKKLNVETANVTLEPEIDMSVDKSMVPSPVKEDVVVPTKQPEEARQSKMSFYSRTRPTGKSAVVTSPCVVPALLEDANRSLSSDEGDGKTSTAPLKQSVTPSKGNKKKKVSELKKMFSPVRKPATSPSSPNDAVSVSSEEKRTKVKGLFSPIDNHPEKEEVTSSPPISPSNGSVASHSLETRVDSTNHARDPAKMSPSNKRNELAQSILKEKRTSPVSNEEQQPVSPSKDGIGIQVPQLEPTPEKPFDMTTNTTFESTVMNDLRDEFKSSPDNKTLHLSESRDDDDAVHHWKKNQHGDAKILAKPDKKDYSLSGWPQQHQQQQERRSLSPTGSTISVEDNASSMKKKSNNDKPQFFSDRSFHDMDGADSPFVGNIKFATPTQRVPASALFSQAFVVQGSGNNAGDSEDGPTNVRWIQTDSPLFVTKKNMENINSNVKVIDNSADGTSSHLQFQSHPTRTQPPLQTTHFFDNACGTGFGLNLSAFDMTNLSLNNNIEEGKSLADEPESESPSFELNETIVYADGPEDAPMDCCGVSNALCGSDNMFEGLVSPCVNADSYRQDKERMNKVPSPRRKNLLSRLRNKKKKTKASKVEYGNLDDDYDEKEAMKGVKNAHVQLTKQNIRGKSMAAASQFALLIDDEMDM